MESPGRGRAETRETCARAECVGERMDDAGMNNVLRANEHTHGTASGCDAFG